MQTFTPPTLARVPTLLSTSVGPELALFKFYRPGVQGLNVFKYADGSYQTDVSPLSTSNPDPVNASGDVGVPVITYYGGHTYQVTDTEAASLSAAGFAANLSPAV